MRVSGMINGRLTHEALAHPQPERRVSDHDVRALRSWGAGACCPLVGRSAKPCSELLARYKHCTCMLASGMEVVRGYEREHESTKMVVLRLCRKF